METGSCDVEDPHGNAAALGLSAESTDRRARITSISYVSRRKKERNRC